MLTSNNLNHQKYPMENYSRDNRGSGRGFGGGSGGPRPPMHKATCSECGAGCELPFRPNGDRPVFCSNCFAAKQDDGGSRPPSNYGGDRREERRERPRFEDRQMFDAVCVKCGKKCQVPFRPSGSKPVYCSDCFEKTDSRSGGVSKDSGEVMEQIKMLNIKLDKLINILAPELSEVKTKKPEVKKEIEAVKEIIKEVPEKLAKVAKVTKEKVKVAVKKVAAKKKK